MSKVQLSGNVSGTGIFTIASPNSNTDRTLALPDASGTILTNSGTEAGAFSTLSVADSNISAANGIGFRNRIINGDMRIDQRNAGASVVSSSSGQYPVDRFFVEAYGGGALTSQQSSTAPTGFTNSTIITVTTTDTSLGTSDDYEINHKIEGFNVADLGWGTANAKTVTLSFWVRSSVATTYSIGFQNSSATRAYVATYTINSADTWEQKTITVPGDTTGSWETGNGAGLFLRWCLATGSARVASAANTWEAANRIAISSTANPIMGTSGATWYITGVQLEVGSVATEFERRPYGTELQLCQRYFQIISSARQYPFGMATATSSTTIALIYNFMTPMRTTPSSYSTLGAGNKFRINGATNQNSTVEMVQNGSISSSQSALFDSDGWSGLTVSDSYTVRQYDVDGVFGLSAEL